MVGVQVDTKDVVIPDSVCQMIAQLLQDININPIPQVPLVIIRTAINMLNKKY